VVVDAVVIYAPSTRLGDWSGECCFMFRQIGAIPQSRNSASFLAASDTETEVRSQSGVSGSHNITHLTRLALE
jgi:hypothetical protein